jgi:hypothetical protein
MARVLVIALGAAVFTFAPDLLPPYFAVFVVLFKPPWYVCTNVAVLLAGALLIRAGDPMQATEALTDYWSNGIILGVPARTFTVGITAIALALKIVCAVLLFCAKLVAGVLRTIIIGAAQQVLAIARRGVVP